MRRVTYKKYLLLFILLFFGIIVNAQIKKRIFLIPGQGSDYRIFKYFDFQEFDTVHINYIIPSKDETMESYAKKLAQQIDTSVSFSIVGVSLGGMIAVEMLEFLQPEELIIISSAKCFSELPVRYKFMKKLPVNKIFGGKFLRYMAPSAQIIVEPDSKKERELCKSMLRSKDDLFMERSLNMIINWERTEMPEGIIHIHGDNDHTIPFRNLKEVDCIIERGSHMMALTRGKEIKNILDSLIK